MANQRIVKKWEREARSHLKGKTVKDVRYLTDEEKESLGWFHHVPVIIFDDGTLIFPSRDDEGNDGGALFGQAPDGNDFTLPVIR
jgi:hypothetical protein